AVESVSGCSWSECPDQRGITVRMCVEWVSESAWNPHSVPQIFINGTLIGGSDELFALDVRGELDKLLGRNPPAT
ncbi:hypothetical protein ACRCRN_30090, partial [Pseudomonas aeruginosa]